MEMNNCETIKYENGVKMILRGYFFGMPVYSKSIADEIYEECGVTDKNATKIINAEANE